MKRGRNQRRRQGVNVNRALDSNGPDVRIRGTANQIYDKYQSLARDASSSGDRVKAESYLQHAEHYFRLIKNMQAQNTNQNNAHQNNAHSNAPEQNGADQSESEQPDASAEPSESTVPEGKDAEAGDSKERPARARRQRRPRKADDVKAEDAQPSSEPPTSEASNTETDGSDDGEKVEEKKPVKRTRRKKVEPAEAV